MYRIHSVMYMYCLILFAELAAGPVITPIITRRLCCVYIYISLLLYPGYLLNNAILRAVQVRGNGCVVCVHVLVCVSVWCL